MRSVPVELNGAHARAAYALDVLFGLLGIRRAPAGGATALAYGEGAAPCRVARATQEGWDDPRPLVTRAGDLAILHLPGAPTEPTLTDGAVGFDLLYATYACLTAPWERVDPSDEVGCPIAAEGWLARNGLLREPLVHRYADVLGRALGVTSRRESAIVVTHDVDNNFAHLFGRRESVELLRRDLRSNPSAALRRAAGLTWRIARRTAVDPNDRFDDWLGRHREWQSRPTFFVASSGLFHPDADRRDVPYDARDPHVRATLQGLARAGAEIGIHFSIGASRSVARLRREREALEEAVGVPIRSARHHWWALGRSPERTLALHGAAGIEVDCSLGFNDRPGFRRGVAAPFHPFDPVSEGPSRVWALPTIAMDAAVTDAGDLLSLWKTVRSARGALVLDWHVHSANPNMSPGAADALHAFLDELIVEGVRLTTPLEAVSAHGT